MATDQLINKSQGDAIISGLTAIKNAILDQPIPTQVEDVVADAFDVGVAYVPGDYCIYENKLYICNTPHHGAWDGNDFTLTTVGAVLESLNNDLNEVTPIKWIWGKPTVFTDQGSKVVQIGKYLFVKLIFTTDSGIGTNYKNIGALYHSLGENSRLVNNQLTILNSDQALNVTTFKNGTNYIEGATSSALVANKWYELATILELNI